MNHLLRLTHGLLIVGLAMLLAVIGCRKPDTPMPPSPPTGTEQSSTPPVAPVPVPPAATPEVSARPLPPVVPIFDYSHIKPPPPEMPENDWRFFQSGYYAKLEKFKKLDALYPELWLVDLSEGSGMTLMPHAIMKNPTVKVPPEIFDYLLDMKGMDINIRVRGGKNPLHVAVDSRRLDMVEYLLKRGADIEALDEEGRTPIFYAASFPVFEFLVKSGAKTHIAKADGQTLYEFNQKYGHPDAQKLLWKMGLGK